MDPERLRPWVVYSVAVFMLVFGTLEIRDPAILTIIVGAALALLGIPAARKIDVLRKNGNGKSTDKENGKGGRA